MIVARKCRAAKPPDAEKPPPGRKVGPGGVSYNIPEEGAIRPPLGLLWILPFEIMLVDL